MSTTSTSDLITGRVIKTGINHLVNTSSLATLESQIGKSLLSEATVASGASEFDALIGTTSNTGSSHRAEDFAKNDIHVITSPDLTNRNYCAVANYVSNADTTTYGETTNPVKINATTSTTVTSKVLDDSSAYKNTSVRTTVIDPYFTTPTFSDSSDNYLCTFDTTNASKLIYTRNVNANTAHTDNNSPTITASEDTAWNTQDGYGSYFINGTVTTDITTGQPTAVLYAVDNSLNFLANNFTIDLKEDVSNNIVPIFGRYQATFSQSSGSDVDVSLNGSSALVLTTDVSWNTFISDLNTSLNLQNLPASITSTEVENWVLPDQFVSNGFTLEVASSAFTTALTLNNTTYTAPLNFDLDEMDFATKNMYILEQSMVTNATSGSSLLTNPIINGTTYNNKLTVTNGSLALETTTDNTSGKYALLDGNESLGSTDLTSGQNGIIESYNSARVAGASDSETIFPRASRTDVSSTEAILDNFAVQYNSSESGYESSVGVLTGTDLTTSSVTYAVTTLAGQTTTEDSNNWSNVIGVQGDAIAIVRDTNSSILVSDISFDANSNTYSNNNDNNLSVIDIECLKLWAESKVYDTTDTIISGVTADIKSFNTTSVPLDFKDIRFVFTAKALSDLSLSSSNSNWTLSCPDSKLTNSTEKLGLIEDSSITDLLLNGADNDTNTLTVTLTPRSVAIPANKFTKFHYMMEVQYDNTGETQVTYDDEFTVLEYVKSEVSTSAEITNFLNVPSNTKLYKRSYTESFKVKTPFRFGYINNLFLTSQTINTTVEYYVLTDNTNNNADLPRYFLSGVKTNTDTDLNATITSTTWSTTVTFSNKDFKTHSVGLQKKTDTAWVDVTPEVPVHADIWYNTRSTVISEIGSFYVTLTLSPDLTSLTNNTFYIDLELDKGTSSFTISGKKFTAGQLDLMSGTNLNTFSLAGSSGTAITGLGNVTYTRDSDVAPNTQASTTLSAAGYTFALTGEMYLSLRIFVCPNGLFKSIKTSDGTPSTSYKSIATINGTDSLQLDTGVYAYGNLRSAVRNTSSATWSLNNDAIKATYYGSTGFEYTRISSLNQEFRPVAGARGFKTTIVRGFTPGLTTAINRTLSTFQIDIAGYSYSGNLLTSISDLVGFGDVSMSANSNTKSMYPTVFGTQTWTITLTYGTYSVSDTVDNLSNPVVSSITSFMTIISDRRGLKILSTSLNTNNFSYSVQYTSSNVLTIRRNANIDAPNYTVNSAGYSVVNEITPDDLRDTTRENLVGNILQIHYTEPGTIPNIDCQFSICPPYLKFTAIDPSTVSTLPFDSSSKTPVTRYLRVNNTSTTTSGTYNPFSSHASINNISFVQNNVKQYLAYFTDDNEDYTYMNVDNYNIKVELGSGLNSSTSVTDWSTVYGPTPILNVDFSNSDISITAPDSTRKFNIYIDQQKHPSFSNFFVYDASFAEYNLQMELGSSFISGPSNGSNSIILEFVAGDCTSLDLYAIQTFSKVDDALEVTFAKYSSGAGISNQFLHKSTANGFNLPYTNKYTKTVSVPLNSTSSLTTSVKTFHNVLTSLKTAITSSTFSSWTSASVGDSSAKLTVLPATIRGVEQLVKFVTLSPNIPRSILFLILEDHTRLEDIQKVPNHRVRYNGATHSASLTLSPQFAPANLSSALPTATNL